MSNKSTMLLEHHLKELKLPTFLREYDKLATQCATEGADHPDYLLRLSELELIDRHHRMVDRRIKAARFPTTKSLDTFDFLSMPSLNRALVLELTRCEYIERCHNVIVVGNSGTGKTHIALGLGLAACQRGLSVGFTTAAALVHEPIEARDERRLLNLQRRLARVKLLIIDELGFVPLSKAGAELLFEEVDPEDGPHRPVGTAVVHAVHGSKALLVNQGERLVSENLGPTSLQALSLLRRHQEPGLPEALLRVSYSEHPPLPRPGAAPTTFYYIIPTLPQAGEGFLRTNQ